MGSKLRPAEVNQCEYVMAPLIGVQLQADLQLHCVVKILSIFIPPWFSITAPAFQH
jgi:hypothetical protein